MPEDLKRTIREEEYLRSIGIRINYVRPVVFQGRKIWALGKRVYFNRPPRETFHEFILFFLQQTLGQEWWDSEKRSPDPHDLMKFYRAYSEVSKKHATAENRGPDGLYSMVPDGATRYLLSVAFDVATLMHKRRLPEHLVRRLRHGDQFQGARYEIGVAAILARLNYDIAFLDETTRPDVSRCEFIATAPESGESIAVEVKSRHRPGVLHAGGKCDETRLMRGDIAPLLWKAESQAPGDRPFFVFIALNAPLSGSQEVIDHTWRAEINRSLSERDAPSPESPSAFTALYVTNCSYHYDEGSSRRGNEVLEIRSPFPRHTVRDEGVYDLLVTALRHYGEVPSFDVDGILDDS